MQDLPKNCYNYLLLSLPDKSLNEQIISYNFSFSILLLNVLRDFLSGSNFFKSTIFPLIHPFIIVERKAIETYQVYYTILLIHQFHVYFYSEAYFLSSHKTAMSIFSQDLITVMPLPSIFLVLKNLYYMVFCAVSCCVVNLFQCPSF